jgi:hypothetical protein
MNKIAIIRRLPGSGRYRLYSKKKDKSGRRKNLGTFDSLSAAQKHEGQVQFFKGQGADDQYADDKHGKTLHDISRIAQYLERAGFIAHAKELYAVMDSIDGSLDDSCDDIPDAQLNPENINHTDAVWSDREYSPIDMAGVGQFGLPGPVTVAFLQQLTKTAHEFDLKGLIEEADELDELLVQLTREHEEQDNIDSVVGANGLVGSSVTDNQNCGLFQGMSDSYFYTGYQQQEGVFDHGQDKSRNSNVGGGYNREETERKLTL